MQDPHVERNVYNSMSVVKLFLFNDDLDNSQFDACFAAIPETLRAFTLAMYRKHTGVPHLDPWQVYVYRSAFRAAYNRFCDELRFENLKEENFLVTLNGGEKTRLQGSPALSTTISKLADIMQVSFTDLMDGKLVPRPKPKHRGGAPAAMGAYHLLMQLVGGFFPCVLMGAGQHALKVLDKDVLNTLAGYAPTLIVPVVFWLAVCLFLYLWRQYNSIVRALFATLVPYLIETCLERVLQVQLPDFVVAAIYFLVSCVSHHFMELNRKAVVKGLVLMSRLLPELIYVHAQVEQVTYLKRNFTTLSCADPVVMRRASFLDGSLLLLGEAKDVGCWAEHEDTMYVAKTSGLVADNIHLACSEGDFVRLHHELAKISSPQIIFLEENGSEIVVDRRRVVPMLKEVERLFDHLGMRDEYQSMVASLSTLLKD